MRNKIFRVLVLIFWAVPIFAQTADTLMSAEFIADEQYEDPLIQFRVHLAKVFDEAGNEFNVPADILKSIGLVESHWTQRIPDHGEELNHDRPPSYGVMGLQDNDYFGHSLVDAAKLLGVEPTLLKNNPVENIRGAAALLAFYADLERQKGTEITNKLETWKDVIAKYSGIPQPELAQLYAYEILSVLVDGWKLGGITIEKREVGLVLFSKEVRGLLRSEDILNQTDYPGAIWRPAHSNNFTVANRPYDYSIDRVIFHTVEGSYAGTISWIQNPSSGVSYHYLVGSKGAVNGEITQFVRQKDIGHHAGNWTYNQHAVGIAIEGFADSAQFFTRAARDTIANIIKFVWNEYGFTKDRVHIIGHNQVPDTATPPRWWGGALNKYDPGGYWNWDSLMQRVTGQSPTYKALKVVGVSPSNLNVRTGPNTGDPLLTTISEGQKFVSYAQSGSWYLLFMPGHSTQHFDGWAYGGYLEEISAIQVEVKNTWPDGLRVRTGTASSDPIIDKICDGQRFVATGTTQVGFDGYVWYNFYLPASSGYTTGWSSGHYLNVYDPTLVETEPNGLPVGFSLSHNYPNPFNATTIISYSLQKSLHINITIYNSLGQKVKTLVDEQKPAGEYQIIWDGRNDSGEEVASGVYFYRMSAGAFSESKKMVLLR